MFRTGIGWDRHRLVPGRRCILAGVEFNDSIVGPAGHSDGDVVCHAVIDSLLGALAMGDIGTHFPDTDPAYADADSLVLLARAREMVADAGWQIANIDCTLIAQRPHIAAQVPKMTQQLATALAVAVDQVSVKATRGEGLGPEGRGDSIVVMATALVEKA